MSDAKIEHTRALAAKIAAEFSTKANKIRGSILAFFDFADALSSTYKMKFCFDGMDIEIYVYYPYAEMIIRNITIQKEVSFCVNHPYPWGIGAVKSISPFKTIHLPVFINPHGPSEGNAAYICGDMKNEQDIKALKLQNDEFVMFMAGQLSIRNRTDDPTEIRRRLSTLKNIITRNGIVEKSGQIFCKKSFGLLFADSSLDAGMRFGGISKPVVTCTNCLKPIHRLLTLNIADLKMIENTTQFSTFEILFCLNCQISSAPTYYQYDESGLCKLMEQPKSKSFEDFGILQERSVSLKKMSKGKEKHRIGGEPNWLQGPHWLQCPECHDSMSFLLQLDSDPNLGIQFGDNGLLYSFICERCRTVGNVVQSL